MSDKTSGLIDRWFVDNEADAELGDALRALFDTYDAAGQAPSKECLESLLHVQHRLGMDVPAAAPAVKKIPLQRNVYLQLAAAAAVLLIVVGVTLFSLFYSQQAVGVGDTSTTLAEIPYTVLEAPEGMQVDAVLEDGSQVWLSSGGRLTYPVRFEGNERHVKLEGEAFFKIARNEQQPFSVYTDQLQVRVLGTTFNVVEDRESAQTSITLHEGSVEVLVGERIRRLRPNERMSYRHHSGQMLVESLATLHDGPSGAIYATNRHLPEIFRMVGNFYGVEVVFNEADFTDSQLFTSTFGKDLTAEQVIRSLSMLDGGFSYRIENKKIVIRKG